LCRKLIHISDSDQVKKCDTALYPLNVSHSDPIMLCTFVTDFYAMISTDPVHGQGKHRGFTFHFKPGVLSLEAQKQKACSVLGISVSQAIGWYAKRNTLPQITTGHAEKIAAIQHLLQAEPDLGLSGNYFTGMAIEDCIQRSFAEVARLAKNRVK